MNTIFVIAAVFIGTIAFSQLYGVPRSCYLSCAAAGCICWISYSFLLDPWGEVAACFGATLLVALLARWLAVRKKCPVLVFLIPGIFPMIPGAGIYWTAYYLVMDQVTQALSTGYDAVKCAVALVLGIVLAFEVPQSFFALGDKRESKNNS